MMRLALLLCGVLLSACWAEEEAPLPRATVEVAPVGGGVVRVEVEVASTAGQQARGLMYRKSLGEGEGMLFVWPEAEERFFWMKDTLIPLDMLFIRDGRVVTVAAGARPLDETPIASGQPSDSVLEVNGGWAARHGIGVGAKVIVAR